MINKVILLGRLTRDPETRWTTGENPTAISRYTLAVNRRFHKEGEATADYINCVVFGKGAEFADKYLRQGTQIVISGRIQTGSYTNRDGKKVYTTDVIVEEQAFAQSKDADTPKAGPKATPKADDDGFMNIPDGIGEELPFI